MGIAENKRIIRDLYDANNRGDVNGFMAFLDDEVRWTPSLAFGELRLGKRASLYRRKLACRRFRSLTRVPDCSLRDSAASTRTRLTTTVSGTGHPIVQYLNSSTDQ